MQLNTVFLVSAMGNWGKSKDKCESGNLQGRGSNLGVLEKKIKN